MANTITQKTEALVSESPSEDVLEALALAEIEHQEDLPKSVVKREYKTKYKLRAREAGIKGKAAKRSNWDWLAQTIAAVALNDKEKLMVDEFLALLDANGIDHSRWTNRSPGWEGRLRMTGRLALQKKVVETGEIQLLDGDSQPAPAEFVAKYRS